MTDRVGGQAHGNAAYSLLLPGKVLYLNALLAMKKFRDRGNKEGAVQGFYALQAADLGQVVERKPQRGTNMVCRRQCVCIYMYILVYFFIVILVALRVQES